MYKCRSCDDTMYSKSSEFFTRDFCSKCRSQASEMIAKLKSTVPSFAAVADYIDQELYLTTQRAALKALLDTAIYHAALEVGATARVAA